MVNYRLLLKRVLGGCQCHDMVEITCNKGFRIKFMQFISYYVGFCCLGNVCFFCFFVRGSLSVCVQISCALNMSDITQSIIHPCRVYNCTFTNKTFDAVFGCAYLVSQSELHLFISIVILVTAITTTAEIRFFARPRQCYVILQ